MNIRKRSIAYIEAPSNLGLKKMPYADELGPGVRKMPTYFVISAYQNL